jgi:predicted lipid carrier protein YhbT
MPSPTEELFDDLSRRRHEPRLEKATGSVRVELVEGVCTEHWYIEIAAGDIEVSRENAEADAAFRAERGLFERAATGEENLTAALLRGAVSAEGDLELIVILERLMPGPPSSAARRRIASAASHPS